MTTELDIARQDRGAIVPAAPAPGTTAAALEMLRGHAEMMSAAHSLAKAMVGTQMVPAAYRGKPDDAAAAILYGAELGLNPIQSLQQVFPVHGQPSIYARTMVALLKARGFRFRTIESTNESVTVEGSSPSGEVERSMWTIERAERAGYTTNKKYETDPQAMLYAKACAEVCRKLAPDVLLGISHTREDLELEPAPMRVQSERVSAVEILDQAERGEPKVQQWQAPAAPSDQSAKPDNVEVDAPASPEQNEPEKAAPAPRETAPTDQQLKDLKAALVAEGLKTARAQVEYVREQFNRPTLGALFDLSGRECVELTHFLMTAPKDRGAAADEQLPIAGAEGGEQ